MNIIYGERCAGKTTMLIMTSAVMNEPIVCSTYISAKNIQDTATQLGINIPKPRVHKQGNYYDGPVLLDDANMFIQEALEKYIGARIDACTFNIYKKSIMERNHITGEN